MMNDHSYKPIPVSQWDKNSMADYPVQCQCKTCKKAMGCEGRNRRVRSCVYYEKGKP
jgi:hypothetical protein